MFSSIAQRYQRRLRNSWVFNPSSWSWVEVGSGKHKGLRERGWVEIGEPEVTNIGGHKHYWVKMQPRKE